MTSVRIVFSFFLLAYLMLATCSAQTCVRTSRCRCEMSDGSGAIDLNRLASNNGTPGFTSSWVHVFEFNPCIGFNVSGFRNLAARQLYKGVQPFELGVQSTESFETIGGNPNLEYHSTDNHRSAVVDLICQRNTTSHVFDFISASSTTTTNINYNFILKGPCSCVGGCQPLAPTFNAAVDKQNNLTISVSPGFYKVNVTVRQSPSECSDMNDPTCYSQSLANHNTVINPTINVGKVPGYRWLKITLSTCPLTMCQTHKTIRSRPAVPTAPYNTTADWISLTSMLVKWNASRPYPGPSKFTILAKAGNITKVFHATADNLASVQSHMIVGLLKGFKQTISVAQITASGSGPFSSPVVVPGPPLALTRDYPPALVDKSSQRRNATTIHNPCNVVNKTFSTDGGPILSVDIFVKELQYSDTGTTKSGVWSTSINLTPTPPYHAFTVGCSPSSPYYTTKRLLDIGTEGSCNLTAPYQICNGPLKPNRSYQVALRANTGAPISLSPLTAYSTPLMTKGLPFIRPCLNRTCAANTTCKMFSTISGTLAPVTVTADSKYISNGMEIHLEKDVVTFCTCNKTAVKTGVHCIAKCFKETVTGPNGSFTFNETMPTYSGYSIETCPNTSIPRAIVYCTREDFKDVFFSHFNSSSVIVSPCTPIDTLLKKVDVKTITSAQLDTTLLELDLCLSDTQKVSQGHVSQTVSFLSNLSMIPPNVTMTEFAFQRVVTLSSHMTKYYQQPGHNSSTDDSNKAKVLDSVTTTSYRMSLPPNGSLTVATPTMTAEVLNVESPKKPVNFTPKVFTPDGIEVQPVSSVMPKEAINAATNNQSARLMFLLLSDNTLFPSNNKVDWVLSVNIGNGSKPFPNVQLSNPVNIIHSLVKETFGTQQNNSNLKAQYFNQTCAYWDFTTFSWSSAGCCLVPNTNPPQCNCSHLTNFALLTSTYPVQASIALQTVSFVASSISVACLLATIILQIAIKEMRQRRPTKILINICANLIVVYVIFMVGIDRRENDYHCVAMASVLHYFLLCAWCWMAVYAHLLYRTLVLIFNIPGETYILKASVFAYGFPVITVITNVIFVKIFETPSPESPVCGKVKSAFAHSYLAQNLCWIWGNSLYFAFLLPVAVIILFNVFVFIAVLKNVACKSKKIKSTRKKRSNQDQVAFALTLATTLGISWIIGYFMMFSSNPVYLEVMSWIFSIVVATQGIVIFVVTFMHKKKLIMNLAAPCRKAENNTLLSRSQVSITNRPTRNSRLSSSELK